MCLAAVLPACNLRQTIPTSQPILPLGDAGPLMEGICFEAALALAGQVFVLTDQQQLDSVYDQIDGSNLCRRRIGRKLFDFSGGRAIVGTWTYAPQGCTAEHVLTQLLRDDTVRTVTLRYRFGIGGDCPYELIRPLWITVENAGDYTVVLEIQR